MYTEFLERIVTKKPSILLSPQVANDMYKFVPTKAQDYLGWKMMNRKTRNTETIEYYGKEPVKGRMSSVPSSAKAPVVQRRRSEIEKHIIVGFKASHIFTTKELKTIAQAEHSENKNDAAIRDASMAIANSMSELKFRSLYSDEILFWEGCLGRMDVPVLVDNIPSTRQIDTNTRTLAALTGNDLWDVTTGSTADPNRDIKVMAESFTGKGARLSEVRANLKTFNRMVLTPKMRDEFKYTTRDLIEKGYSDEGLVMNGVRVKIYNAGWIDTNDVFYNFLPDGYIVGFGESNDLLDPGLVDYVEALNIDAMNNDRMMELGKVFYGTFVEAINEKNPSSKTIVITKNALPVFKSPQLIVSQIVGST